MSSTAQTISGPPYFPQIALLGGIPSPIPDQPISAVLLTLFVGSAVLNMTIFQLNRRHEHKFLFSAMLFGFSMARIAALTMRLVWADHQDDTNIAIAANIFTAAGVLLLFVINLVFTRRILRAYHPQFGWHRALDIIFKFQVFSVIATLVIVVVGTVQSYFTLDTITRTRDRDMQLFSGTYLAVLAFLPIPTVIIARLVPRKGRVEKFGSGRFRTKIQLLMFTSTILSFGAWYRVGVNYLTPRPLADPLLVHHKAAYYCVNFVIELIVVYTYTIARFDRRFHVPDGSKGPGDYSINREDEVFGPGDDEAAELEWEAEGVSGAETTTEIGSVEKERIHGEKV